MSTLDMCYFQADEIKPEGMIVIDKTVNYAIIKKYDIPSIHFC